MKFKLVSPYSPTGDQPQAISALVKGLESHQKHQTLLGVTGSGKTFTLANVITQVQLPTLVISHNKTLAGQLYQEFKAFFPHNSVSYFVSYYDYYQPEAYVASTDTYIEKTTAINDEIDKLRLSATANLLSRPDVIVVASVSCIYNLGSPDEYGKHFLELIPGMPISRSSLAEALIEIQYLRDDYSLKRGSFRLSGDTLTVWPADLSYALKLDFLDANLESITPIDPLSGNPPLITPASTGPNPDMDNPRFVIYPAKHYQTQTSDRDRIFSQIKHDLLVRLSELKAQGKIIEAYRLGQRVKNDLEMIKELGYVNGIENYSRYFDKRLPGEPPYTLLDFFKHNAQKYQASSGSAFLTIIDESHMTIPQLNGMYSGDRARKQTLIDFGFRLPSALDNRPLKFREIDTRLPLIVYASATPSPYELDLSQTHVFEQLIRPTGLIDPDVEIRPSQGQIQDLVQEIVIRMAKHQRTLVTTLTKRTAEALTDYLNDAHKIQTLTHQAKLPTVQYLHADVKTLDRQDILDDLRSGKFDVLVGINLLREGLDLPEVSLVAILDADKEGFLRSKTSLVQTMGRAARHDEGHVIMYADTVTNSMQAAILEVKRRRQVQVQYNHDHQIIPQSIQKPIRDKLLVRVDQPSSSVSPALPAGFSDLGWHSLADINPASLTPIDRTRLIKQLTKLMNQSAKKWDFEQAAAFRDAISSCYD